MDDGLVTCNVDLLKGIMLEKEITQSDLAESIGIDRSTLYRRFNDDFSSTTVREVQKIISKLGLTEHEAFEIFGIKCQTTSSKIVETSRYPKMYMGIRELSEFTGLSKDYFKSIAKSKEAPIVRTNGGGKIFFKTEELDAYMQKITEARRIHSGRRYY